MKIYNSYNNKLKWLAKVANLIACILICTWFTLPYFRVRGGVLVLLILFFVWLTTSELKWLTQKWTWDLVYTLLFFITLTPYLISGNLQYGLAGSKIVTVHFPLFFVGIFMNHYYMYYKRNYYVLGVIVVTSLIAFTIGSVQTYMGLELNPLASRILATSVSHFEEEKVKLNQMGVGGFGYIYASGFLFLTLLYFVPKYRFKLRKIIKGIILVSLTAISFMILKASYTTVILIILSGILLVTVVRNKRMLVLTLVVIFVLILLIPQSSLGENILLFSKLFSGNSIVFEKLNDLGTSLLYNITTSQTNNRINLYMQSANTFFNQPLFGIYGPFGNINSSVGGHSGWLDLLAFYGLFTGVPLVAILYTNFKKHLRVYREDRYYGYLVVIYFLFVVLGFINPVLYVYEIGFVLFMVVPSVPMISVEIRSKYLSLRGDKDENFMDY